MADSCKGIHIKSLRNQFFMSRLKCFFDQDTYTCNGSVRFADQTDGSGSCFSVCQKIINDQDMIFF